MKSIELTTEKNLNVTIYAYKLSLKAVNLLSKHQKYCHVLPLLNN